MSVRRTRPSFASCNNLKCWQDLLGALQSRNTELAAKTFLPAPKPILLKIAPDLNEEEIESIVEIALDKSVAGIIATNTTVNRDGLQSPRARIEAIGEGGLSGAPLRDRSNEIISLIYRLTNGSLPIVVLAVSLRRKMHGRRSAQAQVWCSFTPDSFTKGRVSRATLTTDCGRSFRKKDLYRWTKRSAVGLEPSPLKSRTLAGRPKAFRTSGAKPQKNMNAKDKLIVALDVDSSERALELVALLRDSVGMFKIGMQLFTAAGPDIVRRIIATGGRIFLDLKYHDIPNTVSRAGIEAVRLGVSIFNIHASGGMEMMKRTADAVTETASREGLAKPKVIAVTLLTSLDTRRPGASRHQRRDRTRSWARLPERRRIAVSTGWWRHHGK